jgi:hypothetical protein
MDPKAEKPVANPCASRLGEKEWVISISYRARDPGVRGLLGIGAGVAEEEKLMSKDIDKKTDGGDEPRF